MNLRSSRREALHATSLHPSIDSTAPAGDVS
jgi:hypothetical protein